jgi:membrane-associated phospholipid phosphatase
MESAIATLTNFGDLAVLLPLAIVLALWLAAMHAARSAAAWVLAVGLCMTITAVTKVYFFVCPTLADLHSPSGHTSLSTLVYGAITLILARESEPRQRYLPIAAGVAFIGAIALSRIAVNAHTGIEVVAGLAIGLAALGFYTREYLLHRPERPRLLPLIATAVLLMVLLNGEQLRAEEFLHSLAAYFHITIQSACV